LRRLCIIASLVVSLAIAPQVASGGTLMFGSKPRTVVFQALAGERNDVTLTIDRLVLRPGTEGESFFADVIVRDTANAVTPGDGCRAVRANTVSCLVRFTPVPEDDVGVVLKLADMADEASIAATRCDGTHQEPSCHIRVSGGRGNDILYGGSGRDRISGDRGRDRIKGRAGADALLGGPGRDILSGESGRDVVMGGPGRDDLRGGAGNDVFYARDRNADRLRGGAGTDRARIDRGLDATSSIERLSVVAAGSSPRDTMPPSIKDVAATASAETAIVSWTTNEPATSRVDYGKTATYGDRVENAALVMAHDLALADLACETTYHFRVGSRDAAANTATSGEAVFTTGRCPKPGAPVLNVWYGDNQTFGDPGLAQRWVNVIGHASDPDGIGSVRYSLNGLPYVSLVIDPQTNPRIGAFGDFNIELDAAELRPGANRLDIVARDRAGSETTRTVNATYVAGKRWPVPYTADWSTIQKISSVAQVVDGRWALTGAGVRPVETGYDRLVALGDTSWLNYEVTVPITIHSFWSPEKTWHAGVGVAIGWQGHEGLARPRLDWPLGGLCFYYRNSRTDPYDLWMVKWPWPHFVANEGRPNSLQMGVRYMWKFRAQTLATSPGNARYSCKVWPAGQAEPSGWNVAADMPARAGSVLLVADYADVTFGNVSIRPLTP
jgi:RTX calcium-binding nonapeptide repeat (4 copies)